MNSSIGYSAGAEFHGKENLPQKIFAWMQLRCLDNLMQMKGMFVLCWGKRPKLGSAGVETIKINYINFI